MKTADTVMREALVSIEYNGKNIDISLEDRTGSFTYNDPDCGQGDDCSFSVYDSDDKWINGMFPRLGDKVKAKIKVKNWKKQGDNRTLNCGTFIIDSPGFSGPPTKVDFKAVSQPSDMSFSARKRTQTWENVTLKNIASEISNRYKLKLKYTASDIKIKSIEQSEETDSEFLNKVCEKYGLSLKVYNSNLLVYDREIFKKNSSSVTLKKDELISWAYNASLAGTYTGGKMAYKNSKKGKDISVQIGSEKRMLTINGKADDQADAERQIKAAVNSANEEQETLSLIVPGNPDFCSTQIIKVKGLGVADGKYFVKKVTHTIGNKYETALELFKIQKSL